MPPTNNSLAQNDVAATPSSAKPSNADALTQILQHVPLKPLYNTNDRQTVRLRWLAFYYLSQRELSRYELQQKLLAKNFDLPTVTDLLDEFAKKNYQSDARFAQMVIREALRKNRGKLHIKNTLNKARVQLDQSLDDLIANIQTDSLEDTVLAKSTALEKKSATDAAPINWLLLAVEARSKKYGNAIPTTPKDKARQLRFLQYRGFSASVCFDALKMTLDDF